MALPQGWASETVDTLFTVIGGGTPSTKNAEYWGEAGTPWFSSADISDDGKISTRRFVTEAGLANSTTNVVPKDSIIVVTRVGLGKVAFLKEAMCFSQDNQALLPRYADALVNKYVFYCLHNSMQTLKYSGRGTTISGITKKQLTDCAFPLPPLAEQHRIVAKIDALFSELDKGVEVLQTVRQQLRTYRQAVLKWAFEGREWDLVPMSNVTSFVTSGSRGWAQYYSDEGAKFIRIGNLTREGIQLLLDDIQCVSLPDKAEGLRSLLKHNDMLISITADLGSIGIVPANLGEAYINQHIALTRFSNPKTVVFYAWYLKSLGGRQRLLKNQRGGGKLGLGLDDIRETLVPSVSEEEAINVVSEIESRLSVCDKLEQIVDENLAKAQALRQSILKRAFAGKLVPQDPNDEPAEKLLERIKAAKATAATQTTSARRKRK